jgi:hypothetical protein
VPLFGSALSLVAVALIVDALYLSFRRWRDDGPQGPPHGGEDLTSRRQFMAYAGLLLSAIALIATVWQTLPIYFFMSCR